MGLFDFLGGKGSFKKHAGRAANKRAQNPDRWESIQALAEMKTAEAVEALLPRFAIRMDPSIIDQEEKEAAFQGCINAGDAAVEPTRKYLRAAEAISWPLKILEHLLPAEDVVTELLTVLDDFDTDYERDPRRKIQVVAYLEDRKDPRIAAAAAPFVEDMNDEVRFHAVGAVLAQANAEEVTDVLVQGLCSDESMRVRVRIADGFVAHGWVIPEERREEFRSKLPDGYALDAEGRVSK